MATKTDAAVSAEITKPAQKGQPATNPTTIEIIGTSLTIINQALVHGNRGYVVSEADFFMQTGQLRLILCLGKADPATVADADATCKRAIQAERQYDQDAVQAEGRRLAEEAIKVEKQKRLAQTIEKQEAALALLKAEAALA